MIRWMKWMVRAKSGTSLERAIRRRIGITLHQSIICQRDEIPKAQGKGWDGATHVKRLPSNQQRARVQPVVTSPLSSRQSSMAFVSGCRPATKVVKTIRMIAVP